MGGYGSGRWGYWHKRRPVAEASLAWPISKMRAAIKKVLSEGGGKHGIMKWSMGGRQYASARWAMLVHENAPTIMITYSANGKPIEDAIKLASTPSNLGHGVRWWWLCPRCGRRAGILYAPGAHWRCRRCWKITYTSSNESDKRVSAILRGNIPSSLLHQASMPESLDALGAGTLIRLASATFSDLKLLLKANRLEEKRMGRELRRLERKLPGRRRH